MVLVVVVRVRENINCVRLQDFYPPSGPIISPPDSSSIPTRSEKGRLLPIATNIGDRNRNFVGRPQSRRVAVT